MTRRQLFGVLLVSVATFISALDQTVVGTAMPTVVSELGGVERYAWVFSAYLLLSTVATPLFGRFADIFGRKPTFAVALALFMLGSALCGLAGSMDQLVLFRAVQGAGGGGLVPVGLVILGDLFDVRQRARIQGVFASIWVVAAIVGPAVGGVITQLSTWRWVFFVNLPLGLATAVLLATTFHETVARRRHAIDWTGAVLFALATSALLVGLDGIASPVTVPLAVLAGVAFVLVERRVAEPMISLELIRVPVVGTGLLLSATIGTLMFGVISYLPMLVQGVQGGLPIDGGAVVASMSLGWATGAALCGLVLVRVGPRRTVAFAAAAMTLGPLALLLAGGAASRVVEVGAVTLLGLGIGVANTAALVSAQSAVATERRGVTTSLLWFGRSLGSAVGVAVLGTVLTASLGSRINDVAPLLEPAARRAADASLGDARLALAAALTVVFGAMTAVAAVAAATLVPRLPWRVPVHGEAG